MHSRNRKMHLLREGRHPRSTHGIPPPYQRRSGERAGAGSWETWCCCEEEGGGAVSRWWRDLKLEIQQVVLDVRDNLLDSFAR